MSPRLLDLDARELICELHQKDGAVPISKLPGLWYRKLNETWSIWVNGHMETSLHAESKDGCGMEVEPGDVYVEYNGWPAGTFSLITGEGIIAAGEGANYRTFCDALREAIGS